MTRTLQHPHKALAEITATKRAQGGGTWSGRWTLTTDGRVLHRLIAHNDEVVTQTLTTVKATLAAAVFTRCMADPAERTETLRRFARYDGYTPDEA